MWKLRIVVLAAMVAVGVMAGLAQACEIQGPGLKFCLEPLSPSVQPGDTLSFTLTNGTIGTRTNPPEPGYAVLNVYLVGYHGHRPVVLAEKDDITVPVGVPFPETLLNSSTTTSGTLLILVGLHGETSSTATVTVP